LLIDDAIRSGTPRSDRQVGVIHDLGGGMRGEYMADGSFLIHVWFSPAAHHLYRLSDDLRIRFCDWDATLFSVRMIHAFAD
jgi:hypothetical protein